MKVVINSKHGGFGLSNEAFELYLTRKNITFYKWKDKFSEIYTSVPKEEYERIEEEDSELPVGTQADGSSHRYQRINELYLSYYSIKRTDPDLIAVIEELGEKANGSHARLKIVDVPDDVEWQIDEYDGVEWVAECHRTWS